MPAEDRHPTVQKLLGGGKIPTRIEQATNGHRYVVRDVGNLRTARIHQQMWRIEDCTGVTHEWRDVPVVDADQEQEPQIEPKPENKIPDHVIEEITLSEAAAKAWNDEPGGFTAFKSKEDMDAALGEERVARADVSLVKQLQTSMEKNCKLAEDNAGLRMRLEASIKANEAMLEKVQIQNKALEWMAANPSAHPASVLRVALEGLGRKE
jgi:hypothetical protein